MARASHSCPIVQTRKDVYKSAQTTEMSLYIYMCISHAMRKIRVAKVGKVGKVGKVVNVVDEHHAAGRFPDPLIRPSD